MINKNRKNILIALLLSSITMMSFSLSVSRVHGDVTFDPKLQLNNYLSFSADIIDSKIGYFDDDSNLDLIVAYKDRVVIYEDVGAGFVLVDEIITGDSNFIPSDSNISAIAVGDVIGRTSINDVDSISSILNSSGCIVNDPYPHDSSFLLIEDGQRYNLTFTTGGMGNFSVNFTINYGLPVNSFDLKIVIRDTFADTGFETALLSIYDNIDGEWETWLDLDSQIVGIDTDLQLATSILSNPTSNYLDTNNLVQVKFLYNNATDIVDVNIDYMDIVNISAPSINDIVIGGGKGELAFIQSESLTTNDYTATRLLEFTDYGNGGVAATKRMISDIILGDIDNNNKSNIIASITGESTYVLQANKSVSKDYENTQELIITPVGNTITSLAAYDPIGDENNYTLCIGTRSGSYFKTINDNNTNTFGTLQQVPVGSPITCIAIADVTTVSGSSVKEVIVGDLGGNISVYNLATSAIIWEEGSLISIGNQMISITVGDFVQNGKNLIALGTSQDQGKIIVLEDSDNDGTFSSYWDSYIYIREDLITLDTKENPSGVDTLVSTNKRHILYLSTVYTDTDSDLLSDLGEQYFYRTYPDKADSDEDGLNDGLEIFYYLTDPLNPDTDGDFIPDGLEIAMGTDPLDPMSSLIVYIVIPLIIFLAIFAVFYIVRKSMKQKKKEYERIKSTPNLIPQVQRLILQRLETFNKESAGFKSKADMAKFKRGLSNNMMAIVLDRLYNFLEYLRLKGIIFSDREEETLKRIVNETMEPIVTKTDTLLKSLLMYETKYKQFDEQFVKLLQPYADWKKAAKKGTKIIEQLVKCPECHTLQPAGSAFCLECGIKIKK